MNFTSTTRFKNEWSWPFHCTECGQPYPHEAVPFLCPECGGIFDFVSPLSYAPVDSCDIKEGSLGTYRQTFPLPPDASLISLGEGRTPLLKVKIEYRTIYLKCEHLNPTGSFKDRGSIVLVSALAAIGIDQAVEDSSGNAGASFAAYAARAGIRARIFVPDYASGPKRAQIEAYGADVVSVPGPRSAAAAEVRRAANEGMVYASHAYLPHGLAGMATVAFELWEQLGCVPGTVVMPVGQGSLLIGVFKGFQAMMRAGVIDQLPQLVGVQAKACAPLWAKFTAGASSLGVISEGETLAEGIRILDPHRGEDILSAIQASGGRMVAVDEEAIRTGHDALSRRGFFVEPTSAVVWPALKSTLNVLEDPVVAVLTGTGFKTRTS